MSEVDLHINNSISNELNELVDQAFSCLGCGKCSGGCPMLSLFPDQFNPHKVLEKLVDNPLEAFQDKDIWYCASCYKCNKKCPQGIELPEVFLKLRRLALRENGIENLTEVLKNVNKVIPFANEFFRVCYHPERIPIAEQEVNELMKQNLTEFNIDKQKLSGKNVAIIGSGPAGMFAAFELRKNGHKVTIFESRDNAGGMLQWCIPEDRLSADAVNKDVEILKKNGIEIKTNITIGIDIQFNELLNKGFDALFIASGAHKCLKLGVEGENLPEVMSSLQFLEGHKAGHISNVKKNVVVVGGGNTAMDVASVAIKYGAENVTLLYRRTKDEMPADINEVREVENEGVKIQFLTSPVKFIGNGSLKATECVRMELGSVDLTGRRRPVPVKGSNFIIDTDIAVVAIGEKADLNYLSGALTLTGNGTIAVNPLSMATSAFGVFAGGDAVLGPSTVAQSIITARKAAEGIDNYLKMK